MTNDMTTTGNAELVHNAPRVITTPDQVKAGLMPQNYAECNMLARAFLDSRMYKISNLGQAMVILLTGMDLGVTPSVAFRSIHVIEGKPSPSADLLVAVCKNHPEVCEYFRLIESTSTAATFETKRVGDPPVRISYTHADAEKAGLLGKDNWRKNEPQMLCARAASRLARIVYQDLTLGLYTPDELKSGEGDIAMEFDVDSETVNASIGMNPDGDHGVPAEADAEIRNTQRPALNAPPPRSESIADEQARTAGERAKAPRESTADKVLHLEVYNNLKRTQGETCKPGDEACSQAFMMAEGFTGPNVIDTIRVIPTADLTRILTKLKAMPDFTEPSDVTDNELAMAIDPGVDDRPALDDPFAEYGPGQMNN